MEKILSKDYCESILINNIDREWQRVITRCIYDQVFIDDIELESKLENFLGQKFAKRPLIKIIKMNVGDVLSLYSANYSNTPYVGYQKYKDTNLVISIALNSDYEGGIMTRMKESYKADIGYGHVQKRSERCRISKITSGTAYFLFVFVSYLEQNKVI